MNRLHRLGLEFFCASLLLGLPSYLAWFRQPFFISLHEFDFSFGLCSPTGEQSPISWIIIGGLIHMVLVAWIAWSYYRLVLLACETRQSFRGGDWLFCLVLAVPAFFYLPWLSPDVFYYLSSGWMQTAHHLDPYVDLIDSSPDYPAHPVHLNNLFPRVTTMYGPLFSISMKGIMALTAGEVITSLLVLKVLWLLLHAASARLAGFIAPQMGMNPRAAMFCILLNPVLLISDLGCGHNDHILLLIFLAVVLLLIQKRALAAVCLLAFGAGFKYVPLILLPVIFTWLLRQDLSLRNFFKLTMLGLLFCLLMILPNYLYDGGLANFIRLLSARDQQMVNFLYTIPAEILHPMAVSPAAVKGFFRAVFLLLYLGVLLRILLQRQIPDIRDLCTLVILVFLSYFAIGSAEIHEWYITWFFAFIFWINRLSFFQAGIFFGCALQAAAIYTGHQMVLLHRIGWTLMFVILWLCLWHLYKTWRDKKDLPSPLFIGIKPL